MIRGKSSTIQYAKTQCDSSQEIQYEPLIWKTNPLKHKTELCKTYSQLGYCNYGQKCRFAHGKDQIIRVPVNQQLRKRQCKGFWGKGYCTYGVRCQFGHCQQSNPDRQIGIIGKALIQVSAKQQSRLLKLLKQS